jgi:hypothetical protein
VFEHINGARTAQKQTINSAGGDLCQSEISAKIAITKQEAQGQRAQQSNEADSSDRLFGQKKNHKRPNEVELFFNS